VGETREISVSFPADHFNKDLAGKAAQFKATVTAVKEKQLPAKDDEFAKDIGCENLEDLKGRIRRNLETEFARNVRRETEKQISDALLEANVFDVPPSLVTERAKDLTKHLKEYLVRQGASEEEWKANEEKMTERNKAEAERQVRLSYLLTWVRDAEKIEASDPEVDEAIEKAAEASEAARRDQMRKWMKSRRDSIRAQLVEEKIFTFLIENAKVTEVPAE
jgi:trigger factor